MTEVKYDNIWRSPLFDDGTRLAVSDFLEWLYRRPSDGPGTTPDGSVILVYRDRLFKDELVNIFMKERADDRR